MGMIKMEALKAAAVATVLLSLLACGSQPANEATAMVVNTNIQAVVDDAAVTFQRGESSDLADFSQIYFPSAKSNLEKLKEMQLKYNATKSGIFSAGYSAQEINEQAVLVKAEVEKAYLTKKAIKANFAPILANQEYVKTIDITGFEKNYERITSDISKLFLSIEKKGTFKEGDKTELLAAMKTFEVDVMHQKYHNKLYAQLFGIEFDEVPVTHQQAQASLTELSQTIAADPRDIAAIESTETVARKMVTRTENIHGEVVWVESGLIGGYEEAVLFYHTPVDKTLPGIVGQDLSELKFDAQIEQYASMMAGLKQTIAKQVEGKDQAEIEKLVDAQLASQLAAKEAALQADFDKKLAAKLAELEQQSQLEQASNQNSEELQKERDSLLALVEDQKAKIAELESNVADLESDVAKVQTQNKAVKTAAAKQSKVPEKAKSKKTQAATLDFDFDIVTPAQ